jgi:hypothetical protein
VLVGSGCRDLIDLGGFFQKELDTRLNLRIMEFFGGGGFTNPPSSSLDRTEDPELAGLAAKVAGAPVVEGLGRG